MVWWKYCVLTSKYFEHDQENFMANFGFDPSWTLTDTAIALSYFMFTSISTVGLGDYHPTNNPERILGALFLLFGVLITSIVIENLATMMKSLQALERDREESSDLSLFFLVIKRFNDDNQLSLEILSKMEQYFNYRWANDRNFAIHSREEVELLE